MLRLTDWFPRFAMKHPRRTCFPTRTEMFPVLIAGSMNGSKDKDDVGIETDPETAKRGRFYIETKNPPFAERASFLTRLIFALAFSQ